MGSEIVNAFPCLLLSCKVMLIMIIYDLPGRERCGCGVIAPQPNTLPPRFTSIAASLQPLFPTSTVLHSGKQAGRQIFHA